MYKEKYRIDSKCKFDERYFMQNKVIIKIWLHLVLGCLILLVSSVIFNFAAKDLDAAADIPVFPKVPFSNFPSGLGQWQGTELPISETVLQIANNDDYLSRRYRNIREDIEVTFYLAYTATPVNMSGHRPAVCYVGSGWLHEGTEKTEIEFSSGKKIPCLIHRFRKPMSSFPDIYVLNYYIVNGQVTIDHNAFAGLKFRRLIQSKDQPRYVVQLQISSSSPKVAIAFAETVSPLIWAYLPQPNTP